MARMRSGTGVESIPIYNWINKFTKLYELLSVKKLIFHYLLNCLKHVLPKNKLFNRINLIGIAKGSITSYL